MYLFNQWDGHTWKKEIRAEPYSLPITSSDVLALSYRRLVGAKAIKPGSWDKHPVYCYDWIVNVWVMRNGINAMESFTPSE